MKREEIASLLQQHESELKQLGIDHLCLFGSVARDQSTDKSDIDLAANFNPNAIIGARIASIARRIEEILGANIDLVDFPPSNHPLYEKIERDGFHVF